MEAPTAAAMEGADAAAPALQLTAMPRHVAHKILALLPADERARVAKTARGWHALLTDRGLWTRLDLSPAAGVTATINDAALYAAAARAGGELRELDVTGCEMMSPAALRAVAAANAATLSARRPDPLTVCDASFIRLPHAEATVIPHGMTFEELTALLHAAPHLGTLKADVRVAGVAQAHAVLRNEPPFGPLRIRHLLADLGGFDEAAMVAFAADVAAHAPLRGLTLFNAPVASHAALDALVSAVTTRAASASFGLVCGELPRAPEQSLARLVAGCGGALKRLALFSNANSFAPDAEGATALGNALRGSALTHLLISGQNLWDNPPAARLLLSSLVAHPTLRVLELAENLSTAFAADVGAALAALVEADAAALQELHVHENFYDDATLRPVFQALRRNTHLRALSCHMNLLSAAFARDVAMPAVRANSSLVKLKMLDEDLEGSGQSAPLMRAVEGVVKARVAAPPGGVAPAALSHCAHCGATEGIKRCTGCSTLGYCGVACQRAAWLCWE